MKVECKRPPKEKKMWKLEKLCESPICTYCKNVIVKYSRATVDHVIPVCKGGQKLGKDNWALCCKDCNKKKADMDLDNFMKTNT
jgi:5-methylcytosine-specific restriction endonuclease McrA